ncbi:MAG: carbohydrate kinase [Pyrinomonadaceae bacterium]
MTYTIVGLGELLWDLLPNGKQLGGAPANFAYIAHLLGDHAVVASRIGEDNPGVEAMARLEQLGLSVSQVQLDRERATGTVEVSLDERGEPSYRSSNDVAWDHLEWTAEWEELSGTADAVCFGSLAQRSPKSRDTILRFLQNMRPDSLRLFDVNLRHAFFSADLLRNSIEHSTAVKLNETEMPQMNDLLQLGGRGTHAFAHRLIQVFDLQLVAITRGSRGSVIVTPDEIVDQAGEPAEVVDTVGAGDAFGAALVHQFLRKRSLEEISAVANRVGGWMTTQSGATPTITAAAVLQEIAFKTNQDLSS